LLADVQETEEFSNHLLRLVDDDALRKAMGENSHEHVLIRFSYHRLVRDMSELYYELLDRKK